MNSSRFMSGIKRVLFRNMRTHLIKSLLYGGALLFLMVMTDPSSMPVYVFAVPFLLLFAFLYHGITATINYFVSFEPARTHNPHRKAILGVALGLTAFLALQSIGQLTARDVITVFIVGLIGYFYVSKNTNRS